MDNRLTRGAQCSSPRWGQGDDELLAIAEDIAIGAIPMARTKTKPEETIVMYRVEAPGFPLYFHPQCVDEMCPGQGEPVRVKDITIEADDTLSPDPFCNECGLSVLDRPVTDWIYKVLSN
jgi:hypothetical protein